MNTKDATVDRPPSVSEIMDLACKVAGLDDYGDDMSFVEPMGKFLESALREARLIDPNSFIESNFIRPLVNRLRFENDKKLHPEILDEEILPPLIITGMPRTGTSKLQRMLASAPDAHRLYLWRMLNPAPFPGWQPGAPDERVQACDQVEAGLKEAAPKFLVGHPITAWEVDEDCWMMDFTFESMLPAYMNHVPSYYAWLGARPLATPYAYERSLLQYLQWQDGGGQGRTWVMKSTLHLGWLKNVLDTYPGATIIACHRHPKVSVPSLAALADSYQSASAHSVDRPGLGRDMMNMLVETLARFDEQRAKEPAEQFIDVSYSRICDDAMGVIEDIYECAGRELTPEAKDAMHKWELDHPQHAGGKFEYSLEQYGLTEDMINTAFKDYIDRYITEV